MVIEYLRLAAEADFIPKNEPRICLSRHRNCSNFLPPKNLAGKNMHPALLGRSHPYLSETGSRTDTTRGNVNKNIGPAQTPAKMFTLHAPEANVMHQNGPAGNQSLV